MEQSKTKKMTKWGGHEGAHTQVEGGEHSSKEVLSLPAELF